MGVKGYTASLPGQFASFVHRDVDSFEPKRQILQ